MKKVYSGEDLDLVALAGVLNQLIFIIENRIVPLPDSMKEYIARLPIGESAEHLAFLIKTHL